MKVDPELLRRRASCAWLKAYHECLAEKRPVSLITTEWMLEGMLL